MTPTELKQAKAQIAKLGLRPAAAATPTAKSPKGHSRALPKYIHATGYVSKPFRVCVRRNGINRNHGSFATIEEAQAVASTLALTPGVHTIRGKRKSSESAEPIHGEKDA